MSSSSSSGAPFDHPQPLSSTSTASVIGPQPKGADPSSNAPLSKSGTKQKSAATDQEVQDEDETESDSSPVPQTTVNEGSALVPHASPGYINMRFRKFKEHAETTFQGIKSEYFESTAEVIHRELGSSVDRGSTEAERTSIRLALEREEGEEFPRELLDDLVICRHWRLMETIALWWIYLTWVYRYGYKSAYFNLAVKRVEMERRRALAQRPSNESRLSLSRIKRGILFVGGLLKLQSSGEEPTAISLTAQCTTLPAHVISDIDFSHLAFVHVREIYSVFVTRSEKAPSTGAVLTVKDRVRNVADLYRWMNWKKVKAVRRGAARGGAVRGALRGAVRGLAVRGGAVRGGAVGGGDVSGGDVSEGAGSGSDDAGEDANTEADIDSNSEAECTIQHERSAMEIVFGAGGTFKCLETGQQFGFIRSPELKNSFYYSLALAQSYTLAYERFQKQYARDHALSERDIVEEDSLDSAEKFAVMSMKQSLGSELCSHRIDWEYFHSNQQLQDQTNSLVFRNFWNQTGYEEPLLHQIIWIAAHQLGADIRLYELYEEGSLERIRQVKNDNVDRQAEQDAYIYACFHNQMNNSYQSSRTCSRVFHILRMPHGRCRLLIDLEDQDKRLQEDTERVKTHRRSGKLGFPVLSSLAPSSLIENQDEQSDNEEKDQVQEEQEQKKKRKT